MSRVLINGQDVNYTSDFPEMTYEVWKEIPENLRPNYTVITDRDYTGEPIDNSVSVTADGVKTYVQLFAELWAKVDASKIAKGAYLSLDSSDPLVSFYYLRSATASAATFTRVSANSSSPHMVTELIYLSTAYNTWRVSNPTSYSDASGDTVPASGTIITLYYNQTLSALGMDIAADDVSYGQGTVKDALDAVPKFSVVNKTITVSVTANESLTTNIDWTGVDRSKVLYSWITWSNSASDTPSSVVYYYSSYYNGTLNQIVHKWTTTQTVNFSLRYILMS